jgi:hypothetical protein
MFQLHSHHSAIFCPIFFRASQCLQASPASEDLRHVSGMRIAARSLGRRSAPAKVAPPKGDAADGLHDTGRCQTNELTPEYTWHNF